MGDVITAPKTRATIEDLYKIDGKAELVNGEIVRMSPTGYKTGRASVKICISLTEHEQRHGGGVAVPDNVGFIVSLPHRESFSPDAAWHTGPLPQGDAEMDFVTGAPVFAVEVRSKDDYGAAAERAMAAKRRDYFDTGTLIVWDVDLNSPDVIRKYNANDPANSIIFRRGDIADAEPAVPGWRMLVDVLFR